MICPKCTGQMAETTFGRNMFAHQCTLCQGLWFDLGEAERLKNKWMSEFLDTGNAEVGRVNNTVTDCPCPRCGDIMAHLKDPDRPEVGYEACAQHGMYFDAGEFSMLKQQDLADKITAFLHPANLYRN